MPTTLQCPSVCGRWSWSKYVSCPPRKQAKNKYPKYKRRGGIILIAVVIKNSTQPIPLPGRPVRVIHTYYSYFRLKDTRGINPPALHLYTHKKCQRVEGGRDTSRMKQTDHHHRSHKSQACPPLDKERVLVAELNQPHRNLTTIPIIFPRGLPGPLVRAF